MIKLLNLVKGLFLWLVSVYRIRSAGARGIFMEEIGYGRERTRSVIDLSFTKSSFFFSRSKYESIIVFPFIFLGPTGRGPRGLASLRGKNLT